MISGGLCLPQRNYSLKPTKACMHVDKGDGFTEHSVRRIDFARGTYPQWKNWAEQIMRVDQEKKTVELSAVSGGPLSECGIFKRTVVVSPRMSSPMRQGSYVKWSSCYTDLKGTFRVKDMADLVESTFNKLDENLLRDADRASAYQLSYTKYSSFMFVVLFTV